jgi:hypothetical protein
MCFTETLVRMAKAKPMSSGHLIGKSSQQSEPLQALAIPQNWDMLFRQFNITFVR